MKAYFTWERMYSSRRLEPNTGGFSPRGQVGLRGRGLNAGNVGRAPGRVHPTRPQTTRTVGAPELVERRKRAYGWGTPARRPHLLAGVRCPRQRRCGPRAGLG